MSYIFEAVDCIEAMARLEPGSVDLVVTSPPYNLGIKYKRYKDSLPEERYLAWCSDWAAAIKRVLRPDGSFFLNLGGSPSKQLLQFKTTLAVCNHFKLQNVFHWVKSVTVEERGGDKVSVGHFKPVNSPRYVNGCHEFVLHLSIKGNVKLDRLSLGVPYQDKTNVKRWAHTGGKDLRCRGSTWFIAYPTIQRKKDRPHPAVFPPELAENCIRMHGVDRVKVMLDPFLGIGNSAVAAKRLHIPEFYGYDIDEGYIADAQDILARS